MSTDKRNIQTRAAGQAGIASQRYRRCDSGRADRALSAVARDSRTEGRIRVVAFSRRARTVSRRPDPARDISKSRRQFVGRPDRRIFPAGSETWTDRISRSSPSIARTWDARCAGSRSRTFSCVRVTAAFTTGWFARRRDLRRADCSSTTTRSRMENSSSRPAKCRRPGARPRYKESGETAMRLIAKSRSMARSAPAAGHVDPRDGRASGSA